MCMRERGGEEKKMSKRGEDEEKVKEILSERGEGRAQHAWAAL